jgi:hypothetical protein
LLNEGKLRGWRGAHGRELYLPQFLAKCTTKVFLNKVDKYIARVKKKGLQSPDASAVIRGKVDAAEGGYVKSSMIFGTM